MKTRFNDILACPYCLGNLALDPAEDNQVITGTLECQSCQRVYGIKSGLPFLLLKDADWDRINTEIEGEEELCDELPEAAHVKRNQFESKRSYDYLRQIQIPSNPLVLDVGGSAGIGSLLFRPYDARVVIVEIVPSFLKVAEAVVSDKVDLDLAVASMNWLPFKDNSFDIVFCRQALHHAANPDEVMQEFFRVTKPNGQVLIISEPCMAATDKIRDLFRPAPKTESDEKLDQLIAKLPDDEFHYTWQDFRNSIKPLTDDFQIDRAFGAAATIIEGNELAFDPFSIQRGVVGKLLDRLLPGGRGYRGDINICARKTKPVHRSISPLDCQPVPLTHFELENIPPNEVQNLRQLFDKFFEGFEW